MRAASSAEKNSAGTNPKVRGNQDAGHALDLDVVGLDGAVVVVARVRNLVLGVGQVRLKLAKRSLALRSGYASATAKNVRSARRQLALACAAARGRSRPPSRAPRLDDLLIVSRSYAA